MYSTSNRDRISQEKNCAEMSDNEILERAIVLVEKNAPKHHDLIQRLAATTQQFSAYTDRPIAITSTVLEEMQYNR